jgi:hypothetical protein
MNYIDDIRFEQCLQLKKEIRGSEKYLIVVLIRRKRSTIRSAEQGGTRRLRVWFLTTRFVAMA